MPKSKQSRAASCSRCKKRKVKCSGGVACESCIKTATYRHRDLSTVICSYSDDKLCTEDKSLDQSNRLLVSRGNKPAHISVKTDRPNRTRKPYPRVDSPSISEDYPNSPKVSHPSPQETEEGYETESSPDLDSAPSEPPSPTFSYPNFTPRVQTDFQAAQLLFSSFLASTPAASSSSLSSLDTIPYQERSRQFYQTQPQPQYYAHATPQNLPCYPIYEQYNMYQDYTPSLPPPPPSSSSSLSFDMNNNRQHHQYFPSSQIASSASRNSIEISRGF